MSQLTHIKTIGEMHAFLQYPPPAHPHISIIPMIPNDVTSEFANRDFVLGYYQVILKRGISGYLQYGRKTYDFQDGTIVTTQAGQRIKVEAKEDFSNCTGCVISSGGQSNINNFLTIGYFHSVKLLKSF